jgi:hypothetical protein
MLAVRGVLVGRTLVSSEGDHPASDPLDLPVRAHTTQTPRIETAFAAGPRLPKPLVLPYRSQLPGVDDLQRPVCTVSRSLLDPLSPQHGRQPKVLPITTDRKGEHIA